MAGILGRGAFIVIEGCDKCGKTTQCKKLVEALLKQKVQSNFLYFPDRTTTIGHVINNYLCCKEELSDKAIHLLFSANRWESESKIKSLLTSGITLIVDRYSYSGVAFSAAKQNMDFEWCKQPEIGLPKPDIVLFLNMSTEVAEKRGGFGVERYEVSQFQQKVQDNFLKLQDDTWKVINADKDVEYLHQELLNCVLPVIESAKTAPLTLLW